MTARVNIQTWCSRSLATECVSVRAEELERNRKRVWQERQMNEGKLAGPKAGLGQGTAGNCSVGVRTIPNDRDWDPETVR